MEYRRLSGYPPAGDMMALHCFSEDQEKLGVAAGAALQRVGHRAGG